MALRYQSPPAWPAPPAGWTPPPGWVPDPAWGPAPPGWEFWVEERRPNKGAFGRALLASLALLALTIVVLSLTVGPDAEVIGGLLANFVLGGLLTALCVRWAPVRFPTWSYVLLVIPGIVLVRALSLMGQAGAGT